MKAVENMAGAMQQRASKLKAAAASSGRSPAGPRRPVRRREATVSL